MKKIGLFIFIIGVSMIVTGCFSIGNKKNVTSFKTGEVASIDQFKISLTRFDELTELDSYSLVYDKFISCVFEIENVSDKELIVSSLTNFKLKDQSSGKLITDDNIKIDAREKKTFKIIYDVKNEDTYSILFYSGTVSNNIEFILK